MLRSSASQVPQNDNDEIKSKPNLDTVPHHPRHLKKNKKQSQSIQDILKKEEEEAKSAACYVQRYPNLLKKYCFNDDFTKCDVKDLKGHFERHPNKIWGCVDDGKKKKKKGGKEEMGVEESEEYKEEEIEKMREYFDKKEKDVAEAVSSYRAKENKVEEEVLNNKDELEEMKEYFNQKNKNEEGDEMEKMKEYFDKKDEDVQSKDDENYAADDDYNIPDVNGDDDDYAPNTNDDGTKDIADDDVGGFEVTAARNDDFDEINVADDDDYIPDVKNGNDDGADFDDDDDDYTPSTSSNNQHDTASSSTIKTPSQIWKDLSPAQQTILSRNSLCYLSIHPPETLYQTNEANPPCINDDLSLCHPVRLYLYHLTEGVEMGFTWGCDSDDDEEEISEESVEYVKAYPAQEEIEAECYAGRYSDVYDEYCRGKNGSGLCDVEGIIEYYVKKGKREGGGKEVWGCTVLDNDDDDDEIDENEIDVINEAKEGECYAKRYPVVISKYCQDGDATNCDLKELKKHLKRHKKNIWGCTDDDDVEKEHDTKPTSSYEIAKKEKTTKSEKKQTKKDKKDEQTSEEMWNALTPTQQEELAQNSLCYLQNYPPEQLFQTSTSIPPCLNNDVHHCHPIRLYLYHVQDGVDLGFQWGCVTTKHGHDDEVKQQDMEYMMKYPQNEVYDAECYAGRFEDVFNAYCRRDSDSFERGGGHFGCDVDGIITYYLEKGKSTGIAEYYLRDGNGSEAATVGGGRDIWGCASVHDENDKEEKKTKHDKKEDAVEKEVREGECYAKRYPIVLSKYCFNEDYTKCDIKELKKHYKRHKKNIWGCDSEDDENEIKDENVEVEQTAENLWKLLTVYQQEELAQNALCYIQNYPPEKLIQTTSAVPPCLNHDPNFCHPVRLYLYHMAEGQGLGFQWGCIGQDGKPSVVVREKDLSTMVNYPDNEVLDAECYAGRFEDVFESYCHVDDTENEDEDSPPSSGCDIQGIIKYYLEEGKTKSTLDDGSSAGRGRDVWGCALVQEKDNGGVDEAKEAECYAKRYPNVLSKYCKNGDPRKCDLEELKKHNKRHKKNVWGCLSGDNDAYDGTDQSILDEDNIIYESQVDSAWDELTDEQRNNLSRDAACYIKRYGPLQPSHSATSLPPCLGTDMKSCHPVRLFFYHDAEGEDLGYKWGCKKATSVSENDVEVMKNYPSKEKMDARCYAKRYDDVNEIFCMESIGCDEEGIIGYYMKTWKNKSSVNDREIWGCISDTTKGAKNKGGSSWEFENVGGDDDEFYNDDSIFESEIMRGKDGLDSIDTNSSLDKRNKRSSDTLEHSIVDFIILSAIVAAFFAYFRIRAAKRERAEQIRGYTPMGRNRREFA